MQIRRTVVIAAASTIQNLVAGESIEFASEDSMLTLAATVPAVDINTVNATLRLTDEIVMDRATIPVENLAGAGPQLPYNVLKSRQPVGRGDHLILSATNTDGATTATLTFILELEAV